MSYNVTKLWSQKDIERNFDGWGAAEYYSVTASSVAELADDKNLLLASGLPRERQSHPVHRLLQCYSVSAGPGLSERTVVARYQWFPNGFPSPQSNDPTTTKPQITWGPLDESVTASYDYYGNPITNSAGDVAELLPQLSKGYRTLDIVRYERGWKPEVADQFEGTTNARDIYAGGRKFPAGSMLCRRIMPAETYDSEALILPVRYSFDVKTRFSGVTQTGVGGGSTGQVNDAIKTINANPFYYWFIDRGVRSMYADGGNIPGDLFKLVTAGGKPELYPETEAVNLRQGQPVESSRYKVTTQAKACKQNSRINRKYVKVVTVGSVDILGYRIYGESDFLKLSL